MVKILMIEIIINIRGIILNKGEVWINKKIFVVIIVVVWIKVEIGVGIKFLLFL